MNLMSFMVPEAFVPDLKSVDRDGAIRELVTALADAGKFDAKLLEEIISLVIERERQGSTGIGKGIAVPHIKHAGVSEIVGTVGCSKGGVDFASLDKAPVYSIMLILSPPNNPDRHLEVMETLFAHLQRDMFRKFLRQAEKNEDIVLLLTEADESRHKNGS